MSAGFHPHTYSAAMEYLDGARNPAYGRAVGNNTRLVRCRVGDIECVGIRLHSTVVVAYLPDGNIILNSGGWETTTTQLRVNGFSAARVYMSQLYDADRRPTNQRGWVLRIQDPNKTAPRVQKCRRCKGTGQRRREPVGTYSQCYGCKGLGQRDYGSKPIHPRFVDGMIVDPGGELIGYGLAPVEADHYAPPRRSRSSGPRHQWATALRARTSEEYDFRSAQIPREIHTTPVEDLLEGMSWSADADEEIQSWSDFLTELKGQKKSRIATR